MGGGAVKNKFLEMLVTTRGLANINIHFMPYELSWDGLGVITTLSARISLLVMAAAAASEDSVVELALAVAKFVRPLLVCRELCCFSFDCLCSSRYKYKFEAKMLNND